MTAEQLSTHLWEKAKSLSGDYYFTKQDDEWIEFVHPYIKTFDNKGILRGFKEAAATKKFISDSPFYFHPLEICVSAGICNMNGGLISK